MIKSDPLQIGDPEMDAVQLNVMGSQALSNQIFPSPFGIIPTGAVSTTGKPICNNGFNIIVANFGANTVTVYNPYTDLADGYGPANTISLAGNPISVCCSGNNTYTFVGTYTAGTINVYDGSFTLVASASCDGRPVSLAASSDGSYVYVLNADPHNTFQVFHFDLASTLTAVGTTPVNFGSDVAVDATYAYVLSEPSSGLLQKLYIYNISGHTNPVLTGSFDFGNSTGPTNLVLDGNKCYVTCIDTGNTIRVIDVTNRASPAQVGTYSDLRGHPGSIAKQGNLLFVTNNVDIAVYDVTTNTPVLLSTTPYTGIGITLTTEDPVTFIYSVSPTGGFLENFSFGPSRQLANVQEMHDYLNNLLMYLDRDGKMLLQGLLVNGNLDISGGYLSLTQSGTAPFPAKKGMIYALDDGHLYYYNGTVTRQLDN